MTIIREPKELVKHTRLDLGLTLSRFGARLGVTGEMVRRWEEGISDISEITLNKATANAIKVGDSDVLQFCLDVTALLHRGRQKALLDGLSTIQPMVGETGHVS